MTIALAVTMLMGAQSLQAQEVLTPEQQALMEQQAKMQTEAELQATEAEKQAEQNVAKAEKKALEAQKEAEQYAAKAEKEAQEAQKKAEQYAAEAEKKAEKKTAEAEKKTPGREDSVMAARLSLLFRNPSSSTLTPTLRAYCCASGLQTIPAISTSRSRVTLTGLPLRVSSALTTTRPSMASPTSDTRPRMKWMPQSRWALI